MCYEALNNAVYLCHSNNRDVKDRSYQYNRLALLPDMIVGVHFSECNSLHHVLDAMTVTRTANGISIDEAACVELQDGQVVDVFGGDAFKITMHDFITQKYTITPVF